MIRTRLVKHSQQTWSAAVRRCLPSIRIAAICLASLTILFAIARPAFAQATDNATATSPAPPAENAAAPKADAQVQATGIADPDAEKSEVKTPDLPLSRTPYAVKVVIGFSGSGTSGRSFQESCAHEIRSGLRRMYGSMWQAEVVAGDWLNPGSASRLDRLTNEELLAKYPEGSCHKVILITIEDANGEFTVSSTEFDVRVQERSPVISRTTRDRQSVVRLACQLARDCFRPVLMLTGLALPKAEQEFNFELQAGEFPAPDPSAAQIREGDVLRTFLRQMERRNKDKLRLLQKLDLCYVRVLSFNQPLNDEGPPPSGQNIEIAGATLSDEVVYDKAHVRGLLISHGLVPFGGRGRALQQIALRQRPSAPSSRVQLVLQNRPDRPLICYRVDKMSKLRYQDQGDVYKERILTDRHGELEIAVDPENPTFWLYVYSGSLLLARVPYAPGLIPRDVMKLPDDSLRLGVEGELYLFRDQLVDSVAQKAVTLSLARKASASGDATGFENAVLALDEQPGLPEFELSLNAIRTIALNSPEAKQSKMLTRKVEKLTTAMSDSLKRFFASERQIQESNELQKLKAALGANAPAPLPTP